MRFLRFLRRFSDEILCLVCAAAFPLFADLVYHPRENQVEYLLLALVATAGVIGFFVFLRRLWRKKWHKRVSALLHRVFGAIGAKLVELLEKLHFGSRHQTVVKGISTVTFDFDLPEKKEKKAGRRVVRWKTLENERAKLRYLYAKMIVAKLKGGAAITSHDTPLEIERENENTDDETELFGEYLLCRYDERVIPDEKKTLDLKERLDYK